MLHVKKIIILLAVNNCQCDKLFTAYISFKRSFLNLVKELDSITASSGAILRKYLNDISYFERSTTLASDKSKIDFNNNYLNIRIGLMALRPLSRQYLSISSL